MNKTIKKIFAFKATKVIIIDTLCFLLSIGLLYVARKNTDFCDWYVSNIYSHIVEFVAGLTGRVTFSVAEPVMYGLAIFWTIYFISAIVRSAIGAIKSKLSLVILGRFLGRFISFVCFILLIYTLCCGINYGHSSFSEQTGMQVAQYTSQDLVEVGQYLIDHINELEDEVDRNEEGVMEAEDLQNRARLTMYKLSENYQELEGYYPIPKPILFSEVFSYENITGIYSPFTVEANYNNDVTGYVKAFTACHELSHLRGYMQEEEANFLAFLACENSEYDEFQYSGYLSAWVYLSNELLDTDSDGWQKLHDELGKSALIDLKANNMFWDKYDTRVAEVSQNINDNYLKANGQSEGTKSYDRMVGLLVNWYKKNKE